MSDFKVTFTKTGTQDVKSMLTQYLAHYINQNTPHRVEVLVKK